MISMNGHYKIKNSIATNFFVAIKPYCNEKIFMHTVAINSVAIGYCNKKFVAIAFVAIKYFYYY